MTTQKLDFEIEYVRFTSPNNTSDAVPNFPYDKLILKIKQLCVAVDAINERLTDTQKALDNYREYRTGIEDLETDVMYIKQRLNDFETERRRKWQANTELSQRLTALEQNHISPLQSMCIENAREDLNVLLNMICDVTGGMAGTGFELKKPLQELLSKSDKKECDWPKLNDECEHGVNTKQDECLSCAKKECNHDFITTDEVDVYQCKKCGRIAKEPTLESIQQSQCNHDFGGSILLSNPPKKQCIKCGYVQVLNERLNPLKRCDHDFLESDRWDSTFRRFLKKCDKCGAIE